MKIEIIGVIVAVIFGVLSLVTVYPEGREWLKNQTLKFVRVWKTFISKLGRVLLRGKIATINIFKSPKGLVGIIAVILLLTHLLIALLATSITLWGIVFSPTFVDSAIGVFFSTCLLFVLVGNLRISANGSLNHVDIKNELLKTRDVAVKMEKQLNSTKVEYQRKIDNLEDALKNAQSIKAQSLSDVTLGTKEEQSSHLNYQIVGKMLEEIPDELKRQTDQLIVGTSDWENYGSGDYQFGEILEISEGLGADVSFRARLKNLVLVRNKVFATFHRVYEPLNINKFPIISVDLAILQTSRLKELGQRKGFHVYKDSDLPLRVDILNWHMVDSGELTELLREAYNNG